jgi:hypothetical protein
MNGLQLPGREVNGLLPISIGKPFATAGIVAHGKNASLPDIYAKYGVFTRRKSIKLLKTSKY